MRVEWHTLTRRALIYCSVQEQAPRYLWLRLPINARVCTHSIVCNYARRAGTVLYIAHKKSVCNPTRRVGYESCFSWNSSRKIKATATEDIVSLCFCSARREKETRSARNLLLSPSGEVLHGTTSLMLTCRSPISNDRAECQRFSRALTT